jgi:hypothetical protein
VLKFASSKVEFHQRVDAGNVLKKKEGIKNTRRILQMQQVSS